MIWLRSDQKKAPRASCRPSRDSAEKPASAVFVYSRPEARVPEHRVSERGIPGPEPLVEGRGPESPSRGSPEPKTGGDRERSGRLAGDGSRLGRGRGIPPGTPLHRRQIGQTRREALGSDGAAQRGPPVRGSGLGLQEGRPARLTELRFEARIGRRRPLRFELAAGDHPVRPSQDLEPGGAAPDPAVVDQRLRRRRIEGVDAAGSVLVFAPGAQVVEPEIPGNIRPGRPTDRDQRGKEPGLLAVVRIVAGRHEVAAPKIKLTERGSRLEPVDGGFRDRVRARDTGDHRSQGGTGSR